MTSAAGIPATLPDTEARRRISEELDSTLFVEAAAGTGKTTALVSRITALVRTGRARLDRIVAVTFTEKAAGEMKLRLRGDIEHARASGKLDPTEQARLETALSHLELARIGTIHSFCADLLRERPVEARIDPLFEVAAEDEAEGLLDWAFDSWFERILRDPPEGVRRVLRRRKRRRDDPSPRELLREAAGSLVSHRDFDAPWRRDAFDREREIDQVVERLREAAAIAPSALKPDSYLAKSFFDIEKFVEELDLLENLRGRDYDGLEDALRRLNRERLWGWKGVPGRRFSRELSADAARERRDDVKRALDGALIACDADLSPKLREELRPVVDAYEEAKAREGKLDFLDLLVRARDLVRDDATVRRELQERFTHFFVDEFQDTDPLQVEILLLLAADDRGQSDWRQVRPVPGKLFIVGDPKQSIYRFRRADVALYEEAKRQLLGRGAGLTCLTASFRARPSIQAIVNSAFDPSMRGSEDGSQASYVPLEKVRDEREGQPTVVVLPVPRPYGHFGTIVNWAVDESFPDAVAAFVDWLVRQSGWTVEEPGKPGSPVPIADRHICILLRRFQSWGADMTRPYVRALEARRLPHVLMGGRSFHDREEVLALRNALCAIEWPDDELRVFATMRGPLFAIHDDSLLAFRLAHRGFHPLRWLTSADSESLREDEREVADALSLLGKLHRGRNRRPIAQTVTKLLAEVRAHAGLAMWPTGEQALANALRIVELARAFERRGASSFRAFVERLEEEAEQGKSEEAPIVEEGTEGVRIMTVHRAKGLEFPVVMLADPTCALIGRNPSRHVDSSKRLWAEPLCHSIPPDLRDAASDELRRDAAEAVRIAYVAATRARDLLVLPGIGDLSPGDEGLAGWLEVLDPAIYPSRDKRRSPRKAPGCPPFANDSVRDRPDNCPAGTEASVAPGLHAGAAGANPVVWWDPSVLRLDVQEEVGAKQERVLVADERGVAATEGIEAHKRWQKGHEAALEAGRMASINVGIVTELAAANVERLGIDPLPSVAVEEIKVDRGARPAGRRFGLLVHAVLAAVEFDAKRKSIHSLAEARGRLLGATHEEIDSAVTTAQAALSHPLMRRAATAARVGGLRREAPVLLRLPDGTLAEGVVDLAFRELTSDGPVWTVVDFKTDREISNRQTEYERQVGLYTSAIRKASGEPADGWLLVV
jgi:ATP-dependent exoDNAse (exonuclease V) beta subunit